MNSHASESIAYAEIVVEAAQQRAFETFVNLSAWWPLDSHHIGEGDAVAAVFETRSGGRIYERAADGTECDWGRVLECEPPDRLLYDWQLTSEWKYDPTFHTDVEVRVIALAPKRTRVELRHQVSAYGDKAADMRSVFLQPGGWPGLLESFAKTVE
jgi:uncharacterized protein YndB with AHSA1/START domain